MKQFQDYANSQIVRYMNLMMTYLEEENEQGVMDLETVGLTQATYEDVRMAILALTQDIREFIVNNIVDSNELTEIRLVEIVNSLPTEYKNEIHKRFFDADDDLFEERPEENK